MTGTVYIIKNTQNNKVYIGQTTTSLKMRFRYHVRATRTKEKENTKLYKAMNEIGVDKFYIEPLEENIPEELLFEKEAEYIQKYNSHRNGYNARAGGKGGRSLSSEEEKDVLKMARNGIDALVISQKYGVHKGTIFRILSKYGFNYINTDHYSVKKLFNDGYTYKQIAEKLQINPMTVLRHLKTDGLSRRKKYINQRDNFDYNAIKNDYIHCLPIKIICEKYDISRTTFYRIKEKMGLHREPTIT